MPTSHALSPSNKSTGEPDSPGIESQVWRSRPAAGSSVCAVHPLWTERTKAWSPPYPASAISPGHVSLGKLAGGITRMGTGVDDRDRSSVTSAQFFLTMFSAILSQRGRSSILNRNSDEGRNAVATAWAANLSLSCAATKWIAPGFTNPLILPSNKQCAAVITWRGPISVPVQKLLLMPMITLTRPIHDHGQRSGTTGTRWSRALSIPEG